MYLYAPDTLKARVRRVLTQQGFEVSELPHADSLSCRPIATDVAVIVQPDLSRGSRLGQLPSLRALGFQLVVVTERRLENLRPLFHIRATELVFLDESERELVPALVDLSLHARLTSIGRWVQESGRLPPVLGSAVAGLVSRAISPPRSRNEDVVVPRNLRSLGRRLGCSYGYVRRSFATAEINAPVVLSTLLVIRGSHLRLRYLGTWEKVAAELGYASGSGLCELFRRATGSGVTPSPSPRLVRRFVNDLADTFAVEVF